MAPKPKAAEVDNEDEEIEGVAVQPKKLFGIPLALPPLKYLLMGCGALLLIGGGAGGYLMMRPAAEPKPVPVVIKPAVFVDLPEVLVNLNGGGIDRPQYLKVKIVLELADQTMVQQIQPVMPRVMDQFQTYLRELRANDLDGSAGLYRMKEELTRRVNASISPGRINAVLFKEIVVQ